MNPLLAATLGHEPDQKAPIDVMQSDYLIVGSGLTGAVIARTLTDAGRSVLVLDRRGHLGGNVHDHFHPSGIRVHIYGCDTSATGVLKFEVKIGSLSSNL